MYQTDNRGECLILLRIDGFTNNAPHQPVGAVDIPCFSGPSPTRLNVIVMPGCEHCCVCESATGRAGRGEDSIFREVVKTACEFFNEGKPVCQNVGDDAGPLCEDCSAEMARLGFFEDD